MTKVTINSSGEELINRLVESGRCQDADQVVAISLRLLSKYEEEVLQAERDACAAGMADVSEGRVAPFDAEEIKQAGRRLYEQQHPSA